MVLLVLNAIPAALHAVPLVRVVASRVRMATSWGRQVDRQASASRVETQRDQVTGKESLAVPSAQSLPLLVLPLALSVLEICI